jgi:predicted nucleic acid-binding protein
MTLVATNLLVRATFVDTQEHEAARDGSRRLAEETAPGAGHVAIAAERDATPGLRSDDIPDVEICVARNRTRLVLASHDHGFRRFSRLRVIDPLTSAFPGAG